MAYNKNEPTISYLWQKMSFICGKAKQDGEICKTPMTETMLGKVPSLECPVCHNNVSFYDVEKFASFISKTSVSAAKDGEDINFTNCRHSILNKYTRQNVNFVVTQDKKGKLTVAVERESRVI